MTDEDFKTYAAQAALYLDLTLEPDFMAAVVANLKVLNALAAQFADLPLDPHLDPATVLRL